MSDAVRLHRRQPTRLPRPWDSPGKNTGVGCYCLLQCMKVKSESEVAQSCQTLSNPTDCSPPVSSVHGILQASLLEWGAKCLKVVCELFPCIVVELITNFSHLILCRPLLLLSPITPSIRVFSNESALHMRWPKYWSFTLTSFLPKKSQD